MKGIVKTAGPYDCFWSQGYIAEIKKVDAINQIDFISIKKVEPSNQFLYGNHARSSKWSGEEYFF